MQNPDNKFIDIFPLDHLNEFYEHPYRLLELQNQKLSILKEEFLQFSKSLYQKMVDCAADRDEKVINFYRM